jgi:hypothetical protein
VARRVLAELNDDLLLGTGEITASGTVDVFDAEQAEVETSTLRAIVASDLHNLVFQADFRIVPATTAGR